MEFGYFCLIHRVTLACSRRCHLTVGMLSCRKAQGVIGAITSLSSEYGTSCLLDLISRYQSSRTPPPFIFLDKNLHLSDGKPLKTEIQDVWHLKIFAVYQRKQPAECPGLQCHTTGDLLSLAVLIVDRSVGHIDGAGRRRVARGQSQWPIAPRRARRDGNLENCGPSGGAHVVASAPHHYPACGLGSWCSPKSHQKRGGPLPVS